MESQKFSLDQTVDHLSWVSDQAPLLQVRRVLFHLPGKDEQDFGWVSRLGSATLMYESRIADANDPLEPLGAICGGLRFDQLIAPHTMQPMFDIHRLWHFNAPLYKGGRDPRMLRWETRLWLDGFEFRDGESVLLLLTMNADLVSEVAA